MKYNQLGKSDIKISEVSFGCMSLGEDHEANAKLLHTAFDNGINYFDTADLYQKGENELTLGKAFKAIRDKVVIATKVGNQWRSDGSGWNWNPSKSYILQAVEESLKRLQTDYIDLYQLHGGTLDDPIEETIEAFEQLKHQGKIRQYGISSIRPNVIREYVKRSNIVSNMMQYSLLDRRPEETSLDLLQENNISVLTRGSYTQGLLVNKPPKQYLTFSEDEVRKAAEAVQSVAGTSRTTAEVAVRYVLHHRAVTSSVLGIRTSEQLQDAIQVANAKPLSEDEIDALRRAVRPIVYEQHR
ncbi:aldo/keto reductase [Pontibacter silvestris]|uniref:Aldo/keto reductase n=1 Tax=Pontibacter silvestris TaxID=2305183 RepID=A0ABW4X2D6_9BACT|nr:aldo/keto reductase [Pontibacter silvestris]MCC9136045.1 aldo/keto reductase [Pontibacter silvestris]